MLGKVGRILVLLRLKECIYFSLPVIGSLSDRRGNPIVAFVRALVYTQLLRLALFPTMYNLSLNI